MYVIGVAGKARHGKDFVSDVIKSLSEKEFGVSLAKFPLALPLKARVYAELKGEYTYNEVFNDKPPAVRHRLQIAGTEEGRDVFGEDLWTLQVEAFLRYFKDADWPIDGIVIPDVRFPNEVRLAQNGGIVNGQEEGFAGVVGWIQSDRPTLTGEFAKHPSETSLDHYNKWQDFDAVFTNNLDTRVVDLEDQLRPLLSRLFSRIEGA